MTAPLSKTSFPPPTVPQTGLIEREAEISPISVDNHIPSFKEEIPDPPELYFNSFSVLTSELEPFTAQP